MDSDNIISIKHLVKEFDSKSGKVLALDDINLDIQKGEIFGIIGLSGAGKSTLVRCINFLEEPTSGQVLFEGDDLVTMSERDRREVRKQMGMIFQQFNLLAQRNVLKNVCFPLEIDGVPSSEATKRAKELLELVGLSDRMLNYPAQLSGGQKQRVAIARAIATNPKILLCDEATSALDPNTTKQILDLLKDINQKLGITVIVITHEMKVIESICDRVAIIDKSHIAELGRVDEIFASPKSKIGRQLIMGGTVSHKEDEYGRKIRLIFGRGNSFEPILSDIIINCSVKLNVLYASLKEISGSIVGQMIVQLPDTIQEADRVIDYMKSHNIDYEEVAGDELQSANMADDD